VDEGKRKTYALNDVYKYRAAFLPLALPLVVGLVVYFYRKSREQEGVSKERLRG
jgi:hypothetical protein